MLQPQANRESFLLPTVAPKWRAVVNALLILGAGDFVIRHFNSIRSSSIDLAHHYALVAYIAAHFRAPVDVWRLGDMSIYPYYSHALAGMLGNIVGSPLMGLQLVTLTAIFGLWTAIAIALGTLPQRQSLIFIPTFAALMLFNRFGLHAELFGYEVIGNFFFSELVAQAFCAWIFTLILLMERRGTPPLGRYLLCVVALHVAVRIHLLPTVELFGALGLLVVFDVIEAGRLQRLRAAALGSIALIVGCGVIVLDPAFAAMRTLSANNGALTLHWLPSLQALALLATVVILLSLALAWQWIRNRRADLDRHLLVYKYFACLGAAVALLCLFQMLLLKWNLGSEYACRKYAFALQTIAIVNLALLASTFNMRQATADPRSGFQAALGNFSAVLVLGLGLGLGLAPSNNPSKQDVGQLVSIERTVTAIRTTGADAAASGQDYVVGIAGLPWTDDYLFSIGLLDAPANATTRDLLLGKPATHPKRIGRIVTSVGNKPWDVVACRKQVDGGGLALLDGSCVMTHAAACGTGFDFSRAGYLPSIVAVGFSGPERSGRWSQGRTSRIACTLSPPPLRPNRILISAQGHLTDGPQRMLLSVNGGPEQTFIYTRKNPTPTISLDISKIKGNKLDLEFRYPDAHPAGNGDRRVISIFFHKIRFD